MKGLVFGAGNIGRGFLGLLLANAGFEVTFVDVDAAKVSAINAAHEYPVFVVSEKGIKEEVVCGVSAIHAQDLDAIVKAVVEAEIILTAVGKDALKYLAPSLARGLMRRTQLRPHAEMRVAVVACENVQDNTAFLRDLIFEHVGVDEKDLLTHAISFPNCVVDRIVPNTLPCASDSTLAVAVEEYFQLAIDGEGLMGSFPKIEGVEISSNLSATLEQKLCTLNMAHAIVGYFGYLRKHRFVHDAVEDPDISELLTGALREVSETISLRHASISRTAQDAYANKVVARFRNAHLQDEIVRVARQPMRKLGANDRLVKPAVLASELGKVPAFLASGITAALHYNYALDTEAQGLVSTIREQGIERVLEQVSGLQPDSDVARLVKADFLLRAL